MELNKTKICLKDAAIEGSTQAMADSEVIVPDTKPDILKILQVDAETVITDRSVENGKLLISGRVDYNILYIPDSEGEKIKSIKTTADFRQAVSCPGVGDGSASIVEAAAERVEFNVVNSRKLRLRTIIALNYEVFDIKEYEITCSTDDENAECLTKKFRFENIANDSEHEFTVKESIEIPSGQPSISEILKADARVSDIEYKTVTGKVIIKGSVDVNVLYTDDEGEIRFTGAELPFTEVLDAEGVGECTVCELNTDLINIICEAEPDRDGDMRIVSIDIDIVTHVTGIDIEEEEVLCDCFKPYSATECRTETINVTKTSERPSLENSIREIIEFPREAPTVNGVYNVVANAVISKAAHNSGRIICEGKLEVYVLYVTDAPDDPVYSIKKDIPFSYMLECDNINGNENIALKANVTHMSYNLNSAGELELRCVLIINGKLTENEEIANITDVVIRQRDERRGIVICFVSGNESLWDVAKRYSVPQYKIAKYNKLEADTIESGTKLFIPA